MILPAMRSLAGWSEVCVRPPVMRCSVDSVCSCRRRSCKGAVLSDTSHPALITLTHCYSRWLSGTASVQHSHTCQLRLLTPPVETVVRWDKDTSMCVCVCVKDGRHTQITLPLPPSVPHLLLSTLRSKQVFRDTSVTAMRRQNMTLTRENENNATRNSDTNS